MERNIYSNEHSSRVLRKRWSYGELFLIWKQFPSNWTNDFTLRIFIPFRDKLLLERILNCIKNCFLFEKNSHRTERTSYPLRIFLPFGDILLHERISNRSTKYFLFEKDSHWIVPIRFSNLHRLRSFVSRGTFRVNKSPIVSNAHSSRTLNRINIHRASINPS